MFGISSLAESVASYEIAESWERMSCVFIHVLLEALTSRLTSLHRKATSSLSTILTLIDRAILASPVFETFETAIYSKSQRVPQLAHPPKPAAIRHSGCLHM